MKRVFINVYAITLALLCAAGFAVAAFFAYTGFGASGLWLCLAGGVLSLFFAPFYHETGHIVFARSKGFFVVSWKICFLKYDGADGRKKISFCSPFAADSTQAVPEQAFADMKKRAAAYTAGGLLFGGAFLLTISVVAAVFGGYAGAFVLFGALPYAAYLFLLNLPPFEYAGGKTDMRVLCDILKDKPYGVRLIAAMNAQGVLASGKPYSAIDKNYLENLPVIAEDEPLFVLNEFYSYYAAAELRDYEAAAKHINRIALLSPYLTVEEQRAALCELTYLNALLSDETQADKCFAALSYGAENAGKSEKSVESRSTCAENRAAAAYYVMRGDLPAAEKALSAAVKCAEQERFKGAAASERLLSEPLKERLDELKA